MSFLYQSINIGFSCIKNKLLTLFIILAMASSILGAIVIFANNVLSEEDFKLKLTVVNLDTSENMETLLKFAVSNNLIKDKFDVDITSIPPVNSDSIATITFPENFLDSVLNGENLSPTIVIHSADPISRIIVENLCDSLSSALRNAQSAIYATIDHSREITTDDYILEINLEYLSYLLTSESIYDENDITYLGVLSTTNHYILSFAIFFLFLSMVLFYNELNLNKDIKLLKYISTKEKHYQIFYFAKIFIVFLLYLLLFLCVCIFINSDIDVFFILSLINATAFFVLFECLLFNIFSVFLSGALSNFILHSIFLFISGGIIPSILLPSYISSLQVLSPIYYIRNLLSRGLIYYSGYDNLILLIANIFITLYLLNAISKKEVQRNDNV